MFNNTMRDFLGGLGATSVSMAFAEVVPALNNGVVDCAVTGSLSGNTAGWAEVSKSLYSMSLGWSINVLAVNLNTWNRLDPKLQAFLLERDQGLRRTRCGTRSRRATAEADNCNTSKQPCTLGKMANIQLVTVKPAKPKRTRNWSKARCWRAGPSAAAPNARRNGMTRSAKSLGLRRRTKSSHRSAQHSVSLFD